MKNQIHDFPEMKEYMEMLNRDKSKNSIRIYTDSLSRWSSYFNVTSAEMVNDITAKQYREFQGFLQQSGLSNSSVNSHFRNISAFVKWMKSNEYIQNDSLDKVHNLKVGKRESFFLTPEEVQAMVDATGDDIQNRLMLILMFQAGLRRSEVASVRMEDLGNCTILIRGKGDKHVTFPLTEEVCDLMKEYLKIRRPEAEYFFHSIRSGENGMLTGQAIADRVKKFGRLSGMAEDRLEKLTAHATRRAFGTSAYEKHGLLMAQKLLRHNSTSTTMRYIKVSDSSINDAILGQKSFTKKDENE